MKRRKTLLVLLTCVAVLAGASPALTQDLTTGPPPAPYVPVSDLVALPDFLPSLGALYVDPGTLPLGPFLAYDRQGRLVQLLFMVPLKDLNARANWTELAGSVANWFPVDHVDLLFHPGHPGVEEPHYHIHLVAVTHAEEQQRLAQ